LLQPHRWLGTAIGVGALGLGVWAWRRPDQDRGSGMIIGLTILTAAIVAQSWFGGALVTA
jgi:heme A synthase